MTIDRLGAKGSDIETRWDTSLGLHTAASLQTSIRHADAKAATLFGVQGCLTATVVESAQSLFRAPGPVGWGTIALLVAFLGGLTATAWPVWRSLTPRLSGPPDHNRFAFPNLAAARRRPDPADAARLRDEAWDLVSALAGIALAKHRQLRAGLLGLAVAALAAGGLRILGLAQDLSTGGHA